MLERGAFDGVHAAMMVHPWPTERLTGTCLAVAHFDVRYTGREAHASAAPWEGVNAQDALTVAQVAIGLLRQQLPPGDQVHGVVTEGSAAANIIPALGHGPLHGAVAHHGQGLAALRPRVEACFEAGALATGCIARVRGAGTRVLAHGDRPGAAAAPTAPTPRRSADASTPTTRAPRCPRSRPTWPTCRWPCPPSTRSSASRRTGPSTISASSRPPASPRRPTPPCATGPSHWPGRRSTPRRTRRSRERLLGGGDHRTRRFSTCVPGARTSSSTAMETGEAHHRGQSGLRLAARRALRRAPEPVPAAGRVGAPRGPHRRASAARRRTRSGAPLCTTSTTRSRWWSTSRRSSGPDAITARRADATG